MNMKQIVTEFKEAINECTTTDLYVLSTIVLLMVVPAGIALIIAPATFMIVILIFAGAAGAIHMTGRFLRWWASN